MSKVLIAIPAWNEETSLPGVIKSVASHRPDAKILVVDDGSTDETAHLAAEAGVRTVSLLVNVGVGGAVRAMFSYDVRNSPTN